MADPIIPSPPASPAAAGAGGFTLDPSKVPPYIYLFLMLSGGAGLTGLNFYGDNDAKSADIARIEAKVEALDEKQDEILEKFTELRILVIQNQN